MQKYYEIVTIDLFLFTDFVAEKTELIFGEI